MQPNRPNTANKQSGFTLVEMAIVIAIVGVLVGSAFSIINPLVRSMQETKTKERMEKVADAIANYTQRHYRVPCPAPADKEKNSAGNKIFGIMMVDGSGNPDCDADTEQVGVVPFRTLGIPEENVRDAWGNYFTYAVSPAYADEVTNPQVHANCRIASWIDGGNNMNTLKAQFCCALPDPDTANPNDEDDIILNGQGGLPLIDIRSDSDFAAPNTGPASYVNDNIVSVAYILISHGMNGYGHYLINSATPDARYTQVSHGTGEEENQNGDNVYVQLQRNELEGNNYFDDIILWRTQEGVMYEFGNDSCALP